VAMYGARTVTRWLVMKLPGRFKTAAGAGPD
jgi:hypothetical protein